MKSARSVLCFTVALVLCACATVDNSGSTSDVRIVRDNYGVPHIYADTVYGLFYGYGHAVAEDRLFQMEMARRATQGLVAEVLGEAYADFDVGVRTGFLPASIHAQLAALPQDDQDIFAGYAAGMNAWLDKIDKRPQSLLPKEFTDVGFLPERWTAYDVAMIFVGTMANRFGDFNTELENSQILASLTARHGKRTAAAIFNSLNPRLTRNSPTTLPAADWPAKASGVVVKLRYDMADDALSSAAVAAATPRVSGFSNCFVLGPGKTADGHPILVNGPQFGWFVPSYVYSVGLHGAGFDMVGNTPFAYPVLLFGHNGKIAWGSTWGAGDIVDLYRETLNPDDASQYWFNNAYHAFETRVERIAIKGGTARDIVARRSVHGPIVAQGPEAGVVYAKRRVWDGKELQSLLAWLHSGRVSSYDDWIAHAEQAALNINWYYADTSGNIGYAFVGHYQERAPSHDNRFPAHGDGSMEWLGRKPFATNPHALNPASGYIANWNNKPADGVLNPDEFWYSWSSADRVDYLHQAIESRQAFTPDQAWAIISGSSYADINAPYFLDLIQAAADQAGGTQLVRANALLQQWDLHSRDRDNDGFYDEPQTVIFRAFLKTLISDVLADDLGDTFRFFAATGYPLPGQPTPSGMNIQVGTKAVVEALNAASPHDFLNGQSAVAVVHGALNKALGTLAETHGHAMEHWRTPVGPRPFLTKNFLGVPQTGEENAMTGPVEQNRGTENNMFVMKPGRVIGYEVAPPGQSGFISPAGRKGPHYDDQFELYNSFGKKRMWFYPDEVQKAKQSEITLPY